MATNDIKLIQEQNDGGFIERVVPGTPGSVLAVDESGLPITRNEADPVFAAWLTTALPGSPTEFAAVVSGPYAVALTWVLGLRYTGTNIYRDGVLIHTAGFGSNSYTDSGLTPETEYSYTVKSVNSFGESAAAGPVVVTTDAPPVGSYALQFDGSQNGASAPQSAAFTSQSMTWELWVKGTVGSETYLTMGPYISDGASYSVGFQTVANQFWFVFDGGACFAPVSLVDDGNWHHLAATYDGSNVKLWVDGALIDTASASGDFTNNDELTLGYQKGFGRYFGGSIDEVRISSVVRYTDTFTPAYSYTPDSDTVAYWQLNEGTGLTAADASGNGHTLTLIGDPAPAWVDGVKPSDFALEFNSSDGNYATCSDVVLAGDENWTLEGWLKCSSMVGESWFNGIILPSEGNPAELYYHSSSEILVCDVSGVGGGVSASIPIDEWFHFALVHAASGDLTAYINGSSSATGTLTDDLHILGISDSVYGFNGIVDELRASSVVRYSDTFIPATSHTVDSDTLAYWQFNEGTGTTAADVSGNGHTLTLLGDPLPAWVDGVTKADKALSYASGSQLTVPPMLGTAAWTFECWFKLNNAPDGYSRRLLNVNQEGIALYFGCVSGAELFFSSNGWGVSGGTISPGVWHHAAVSSNGSTSYLFLDGELIDTSANGRDYSGDTLNFEIGFNSGQPPETLDGTIDEVRISSVARYTDTFIPATSHTVDADTVAYWKLNEGTGTTAFDTSGNGYDATLTGDTLPQWVDGVTA